MDSIFNKVCVLVTAAFALTLVPGFSQPERSLLSRRDQGTALLVFMVLGLVEETTVSHAGWLNERIVAVCASGLLAGPWVGLAIGLFVTWLAVARHGLPLGSIAISMLCGGLAGGWLNRWRPKLAAHPLTGFCLTFGVSLLRSGLTFFLRTGFARGAAQARGLRNGPSAARVGHGVDSERSSSKSVIVMRKPEQWLRPRCALCKRA